jgi:hypothetical protein
MRRYSNTNKEVKWKQQVIVILYSMGSLVGKHKNRMQIRFDSVQNTSGCDALELAVTCSLLFVQLSNI